MSQDSNSGDDKSNSGRGGSAANAFNAANSLEDQIADLSPEGRDKVRMIQQLSADRTENEMRAQQRNHGYRVLKTKVELLENYIRSPVDRPPEIRADPTPDLKIIDEDAERIVRDREAYFLNRIEKETAANIRQLIARERQAPAIAHDEPEHDH